MWRKLKRRTKLAAFHIWLKFKKELHIPLDLSYLNQYIATQFPLKQRFRPSIGSGELTVKHANLEISNNTLYLNADCQFDITALNQTIYHAKIKLIISGELQFYKKIDCIGLVNPRIEQLKLVDDDYVITQQSINLIHQILPGNSGKHAFTLLGGIQQTINMLSGQTLDEAKNYFSMYLNGNKQKILEFHKQDIENSIQSLSKDPCHYYHLNPHDFEEELFIRFGSKIKVHKNNLQLYFDCEG